MILFLLSFLGLGMLTPPVAHTRTYCGVRSGTAGNAYLDAPKDKDTLVLATQGGSQQLLQEIDSMFVADGRKTGTQNGERYCAVVQLDASDEPVKVVKAWRQHK